MLPGSSRPVGDLTCSGVASSSSSSLFRGVVVIIDGSHPSDPGSIPGERKKSSFQKTFVQTSLPQLTTSFDPGRSILFLVFWCLVFWCLVFGVWCLAFDVWCLVFGVWCLAFGVWRLVFGVWCLVVGWRLVFGVWRLAFGVWCLVFGVWCLLFGVVDCVCLRLRCLLSDGLCGGCRRVGGCCVVGMVHGCLVAHGCVVFTSWLATLCVGTATLWTDTASAFFFFFFFFFFSSHSPRTS